MFDLPAPVLEIRKASLRKSGRFILTECDLQLYPSEVLALVGPSGAGKSSLLNILVGKDLPTHCLAFALQGRDVHGGNRHDVAKLRRRFTGYVAQDSSQTLSLELSSAANIARRLFDLGMNSATDALSRAVDWSVRLGLAPERLHEPVSSFSGGMRQRVQIAAAMVHEPAILFLDEPTAGLDSVAQAEFLDCLLRIKSDSAASMVFVTHDLRLARLIADRVLVMDKGRIVSEAIIDRLLTEPEHPTAEALVKAMI